VRSRLFAADAVVQTFVVRLWTSPEPSSRTADSLRGIVEHLRSGRKAPFADEDELLAFLRERLGEPVAVHRQAGAV
jgi:hypothetical protein